jgi:hypothetical protein
MHKLQNKMTRDIKNFKLLWIFYFCNRPIQQNPPQIVEQQHTQNCDRHSPSQLWGCFCDHYNKTTPFELVVNGFIKVDRPRLAKPQIQNRSSLQTLNSPE